MTPVRAVRLGLGAALVLAPDRVLHVVGAQDADETAVHGVARVLGGRYVLQGVVGHPRGRVGAAVEVSHAASMVPFALRSPHHRRSALVSAGAAVAVALLDLRTGGR